MCVYIYYRDRWEYSSKSYGNVHKHRSMQIVESFVGWLDEAYFPSGGEKGIGGRRKANGWKYKGFLIVEQEQCPLFEEHKMANLYLCQTTLNFSRWVALCPQLPVRPLLYKLQERHFLSSRLFHHLSIYFWFTNSKTHWFILHHSLSINESINVIYLLRVELLSSLLSNLSQHEVAQTFVQYRKFRRKVGRKFERLGI